MAAYEFELVRGIRRALEDVADPAKAAPMQSYMKSEMPYRGVPSPVLKAMLRPLLSQQQLDEEAWHATVLELWDNAAFREERYAALALARHRLHREHRQPHTLALYEHLVRTGAWWDLVDETSTHLVREVLLDHPSEVAPVIRDWAVADDLWVRRSAIICQVGAKDRCDQATAGRDDRGEPRRLDPDHTRRLAVRPRVLHPQGHRLGAARPCTRRPGLGAGVRGPPRRRALGALPAGGTPSPRLSRSRAQP